MTVSKLLKSLDIGKLFPRFKGEYKGVKWIFAFKPWMDHPMLSDYWGYLVMFNTTDRLIKHCWVEAVDLNGKKIPGSDSEIVFLRPGEWDYVSVRVPVWFTKQQIRFKLFIDEDYVTTVPEGGYLEPSVPPWRYMALGGILLLGVGIGWMIGKRW